MKALVLVDIQNDFLPGGALAVPNGDAVVPVANRLMRAEAAVTELIVATQDWHPRHHGSFAANHPGRTAGDLIDLEGLQQILWPVHCVQHTRGAQFAPGLVLDQVTRVFPKGTDARIDSYSGFFDNGHRQPTGLGDFLRERGVTEVIVLGLATEYCVKFTALDARQLGFDVTLVTDGCRGIDVRPGDVSRALEEMGQAGVTLTTSEQLLVKAAGPH
jgi:nicotinamidase/pyrazinamidase